MFVVVVVVGGGGGGGGGDTFLSLRTCTRVCASARMHASLEVRVDMELGGVFLRGHDTLHYPS